MGRGGWRSPSKKVRDEERGWRSRRRDGSAAPGPSDSEILDRPVQPPPSQKTEPRKAAEDFSLNLSRELKEMRVCG